MDHHPTPSSPILLPPPDAARLLGVSVATLTDWRQRGAGPAFVRIGDGPRGRVRYPADALRMWIQALPVHQSTAEYDPRPTPDPRQIEIPHTGVDLLALATGSADRR
ncbi:MAG: helix-turn-helix domain-containing protein [Candidatus Eisenbacteria bacterium]|nr:helix-turn-helix domain-containing protein [Candidatus Eisenbacteria bacterium]